MAGIDIDGLLDFIKDKAITELKGTIKELEDKLTDSNNYQERLIRDLENCCKRYEELEKENERLKETYGKRLQLFCDMYNLLQTENIELFKINRANEKSYEKFWYKVDKYQKTLIDIKDITEDFYNTGIIRNDNGDTLINNNDCIKTLKQIIKKISEVFDERF